MFDFLKIRDNRIFRNAVTVSAGDMASAVFGAAAGIIAVRVLGPRDFGIVALCVSVITFLSGLADPGLFTAMIRFASKYLEADERKTELIFNTTLFIKICFSVFFSAGLFFLSGILAEKVFLKPSLALPLRLSALGVFGSSMFVYITGVFQAMRRFSKYAFLSVIPNLFKLAGVLTLIFLGRILPLNVLKVYVVCPLIGFSIGLFFIPGNFLDLRKSSKATLKELMDFGKWVMVSFFSIKVVSFFGVFMLGRFHNMEQVGLYSAAERLIVLLLILQASVGTVLLPELSRFTSRAQYISFIGKLLRVSALVGLFLLVIFFAAESIVTFLFTERYVRSAGILRILVFWFFAGVLISPLGAILYTMDRPKIVALSNTVQMLVAVFAAVLLIPKYAAFGAAAALAAARIPGMVILPFFVYRGFANFESGPHE
jgi:O-antigen/teichoic acid export membrane protein